MRSVSALMRVNEILTADHRQIRQSWADVRADIKAQRDHLGWSLFVAIGLVAVVVGAWVFGR